MGILRQLSSRAARYNLSSALDPRTERTPVLRINDMLIMKLAVLSCAFYLGIALLAELAFFLVTLWKDSFGIFFTWWGWAIWSGAAWLFSTGLAFWLVWGGIRTKLSHP
jgi:hypothetical protein